MLNKIIACILNLFWCLVSPIVNLCSVKHTGPKFARPGRRPPDSTFFPYYFQNRNYLWLRWAEWKPVGAPKAVVFFVSGLAEHNGRYDSMAKRFTDQGFIAFSLDHQGQGLSEGDRKHVERFADYVNDYHDFVQQRLCANDNALEHLPRFILGHSMGGLIATHLLLRHPKAFNGAILSAPALVPDPKTATPFLKNVAMVLGDYFPKLGLDNLNANWVSNNQQVVQLYVQDPAVPNNKLRARWAAEMLKSMDAVWKNTANSTFPFLLLHGAKDRIVLIEGSEKLMQEAKSTDKKLVVYENAAHEFFTDEAYCERAYTDVFAFVKSHMVAQQPLTWGK